MGKVYDIACNASTSKRSVQQVVSVREFDAYVAVVVATMLPRVDKRNKNMLALFSQQITNRNGPIARFSPTSHPRPLSCFHNRIHVLVQFVMHNSFTWKRVVAILRLNHSLVLFWRDHQGIPWYWNNKDNDNDLRCLKS